jgi:hypothetical protein
MEVPEKITSKELPYDPAIPLPGIYPKELKSESQRDICYHVLYSPTHGSHCMKTT